MRMSEFWQMVEEEFGDGYGRVLVDSHVLGELGYRTGADALADGTHPKHVWRALCIEMDVPKERWLGRDKPIREGGRAD
ncbi:DUF3046 domain-containing protein [Yimella sp. NH-Cas1]|uniref:DUF3046 domain-containing protein n=1 Tax=Yimella sp. NH-Cas1 TaxID=2917726 RepID=UPI001EFAECD6|nr:DUF3046 domain-containing protein [Yimella sp. NH-Cas1]MCG8655692.1 DUF3046 domain-containing protein [Yimella sp. NH-Cas1]